MVIFLQLCIFAVFAVLRGRTLFGIHLSPISPGSKILGFTLGYRGSTWARHVGLELAGSIPFVVRREKFYHRLLKRIGIGSEIHVGNPVFDEHYFITTDFPGHLETLLASAELQRDVSELFKLPIKSLHATRHRIWCVIAPSDVQQPDHYFDRHLELLRGIFGDTRAALAHGHASRVARWQGAAALSVIAVQAGLLTLGILGFLSTYADSVHTADPWALGLKGVVAGALAAVIWLCGIFAVFVGSSWVAWVVADFALCGLIGFLLSGIILVRDANVELAQPAAKLYRQPVVQKLCVLRCKQGSGRRGRRSSYSYKEADCRPQSREQIIEAKRHSNSICASRAWFEYEISVKHWRTSGTYVFRTEGVVFDSVSN